MAKRPRSTKSTSSKSVEEYKHPEAKGTRVPDAGAQPFVKSKHPEGQYRFDSSLSPSLEWDEGNPAREQAESLIAEILDNLQRLRATVSKNKAVAAEEIVKELLSAATHEKALAAATKLKAMSAPFLNWAGKAERPSLDVPTLPLFVHERLSTKAIIETIKGHRHEHTPSLFNDPQLSFGEQAMQAYQHGPWSNRMILGDNLRVMNWLLKGENLGGQVQMIYIDPPYGIKYGSNFQPFVRKRDVSHNDDDDLTREPEMVQAYRDTWEVGLHSYLTYLRDRLTIARDLLHPSGSVFVQISDDNLHHTREILDEVFGSENFCGVITFKKVSSMATDGIPSLTDYLIWYCKDNVRRKFNPLFIPRSALDETASEYTYIQTENGDRRKLTAEENANRKLVPASGRLFRPSPLTSQDASPTGTFDYEYAGRTYHPGANRHWATNREGLARLKDANRLFAREGSLAYIRFLNDFPVTSLSNVWMDTGWGFAAQREKVYVVQTHTKVIERCILMTSDPGDLVLDPTCGSGTTAYIAEQWGRRWITIDVSRVPLALARQRLLTATFDWYQLKDDDRGPIGGFVYKRKQNRKGEEIGGIVPHVTLKSIANNEAPAEEILVDRPEKNESIIRVTGPFTFEASIPPSVDDSEEPPPASGNFAERLLDALRRSPKLHFEGNHFIEVRNVRPLARSMDLSAEGEVVNDTVGRVAFLFGPENGPVSDKQVVKAIREASMKGFDRLLVIGLNIQPIARLTIEQAGSMGIVAAYLQATPDLLMGDLLKNMRSSQVFSVCGLPDVVVRQAAPKQSNGTGKSKGNGKKPASASAPRWEVELLGLDVFDPVTMEPVHRSGNDVPAWFLDTNYNDKCFHVCQAFFPRTGAWDNLKKELKSGYEEGVWDHLAGTVSAPFEAGDHRQIAVKVIDDRGNELMVVKPLVGGK